MFSLRLAALVVALASTSFAQQPVIQSVLNNYSYVLPELPNYGIAQGSIFVIFGTNLANSSTPLQNAPLPTTLNGVSASATVGGVTRPIILYYVTPTQVAGILPSSLPVGTGTITVTNNGQTSAAAPLVVVQSAFGLMTLSGTGSGGAAVFDARSTLLGPANATHPGDVIVFFGTGAGPIPGDETLPPAQTNLAGVPIRVEIGGREARVLYHGRTTFPGLDQVNIEVPAGVTPGCAVSASITSGNYVSNFATIPVAASGANCPVDTNSNPELDITQAELDRWVAAGQYTVGSFGLSRSTSYSISDNPAGGAPIVTTTRSDVASAGFNRVSGNIAQLFVPSQLIPTAGSCSVTTGFTNPVTGVTYQSLDAGTPLTVSGQPGARSLPRSVNSVGLIVYSAELGNGTPGNYIDPGMYTFTGPGGPDIGAFTGTAEIAPELVWTNRADLATITRANGATVTWTGGEPTTLVTIQGQSFVIRGTQVTTAVFQCWARNTDGRFTIPASVLLTLPPSGTIQIAPGVNLAQRGTLALATVGKGARIRASGLDYGMVGNQVGVAQSALWR